MAEDTDSRRWREGMATRAHARSRQAAREGDFELAEIHRQAGNGHAADAWHDKKKG